MAAESIAITVGRVIATRLATKFSGSVIEKWNRHKAQQFFEAFAAEVAREGTIDESRVDAMIDEITADPIKSEALYDAYRSVCLAASKNLGPRIIGLLTGHLVANGTRASEEDEKVFRAAESLNDNDLYEFWKKYGELRERVAQPTSKEDQCLWLKESLVFVWYVEELDTSAGSRDVFAGSLDLDDALGNWGTKMKHCGLLFDHAKSKSSCGK